MNKIVREHYPVAQLPKELRPSDDPTARVTVTVVEEEANPETVVAWEEIFSQTGFQRRSKAEIDDDIRRQRDEWND